MDKRSSILSQEEKIAAMLTACNLNPVVVLRDFRKFGISSGPSDPSLSATTTSSGCTGTSSLSGCPTSIRNVSVSKSPSRRKSICTSANSCSNPSPIDSPGRLSVSSIGSSQCPSDSLSNAPSAYSGPSLHPPLSPRRSPSSSPPSCPPADPTQNLSKIPPSRSTRTPSRRCSSSWHSSSAPALSPRDASSCADSKCSLAAAGSSTLSLTSRPKRPIRRLSRNTRNLRSGRPGQSGPGRSIAAPGQNPESESETSSAHVAPAGPARPKKRMRRQSTTWDPTAEYELDEILGYHRDERDKMWYLIKWKNCTSKDNTFEPIENLTGCQEELTRYFEDVLPSSEDILKKGNEVTKALKSRVLYKRLKAGNYQVADLEKFKNECLDLKSLFTIDNLDQFEKEISMKYEMILRCLIGMYGHQDEGLFHRAQHFRLMLKLVKLRRRQLEMLAVSESLINAMERTEVKVENTVDLETLPEITYISEMKPGEGVNMLEEPVLGCECPTGCNPRSLCCGKISYSVFAYNHNDRLRVSDRIPIYECNSACKCPPTCSNRVVQRGRQVKLCIFKTKECGWGVKTLEKIPKGMFVCQYIGELIPDSVAVVRDVEYHSQGKSRYLFDLDYFEDASLEMYCIDATHQGNLARFINHSCDPNLVVYPVWVNCLAPNLHRLAFFAKRTINKDEEIHFDYENLQDRAQSGKTYPWGKVVSDLRCQCKSENCRKWIFGNK